MRSGPIHEYMELLGAPNFESASDLELTEFYQNAISEVNLGTNTAYVQRRQRGIAAFVRIEIASWARRHVEDMNTEAEEQERAAREARLRSVQGLNS